MRKGLLLVCVVVLFSVFMSCGESLTDKQLFEKAKQYESEEKADLAVTFYQKLADTYPQSGLASEALFRIAVIAAGQKQDWEKAIEVYSQLVSKFPDSEFAPKSQFMVGYIYANEIKDFEKAKAAYNKFIEAFGAVDSGMTASAKFELENMGKDISEIGFLKNTEEEKAVKK
ncbi:tetratricopeptide repeat protein [candidate division KSB1 bacterium]|nr:tetratricopeptide repeat protein [candidate division KSB1 bacterium]